MKRIYLIAGSIAVLLLICGILIFHYSGAKHPTHPPAQEKGSATVTVAINNTAKLADILLPEQFGAVNKTLSNYIHTTYGNSVTSADIVPSSTKVNSDGSITFVVEVNKPESSFTVLLQRPSDLEIDFSVPGTSQPPVSLFPFSNPQ